MEPREVCTTVIKQYPSLKMETQCDLQPRETCTPERVQPQLVTRPVIKKICTKAETALMGTAITGDPLYY